MKNTVAVTTLLSLVLAATANADGLSFEPTKNYQVRKVEGWTVMIHPGLAKEQLDIGIEGDVVRVSSKADAARSVKAAWRFPLEIDVAGSSARLENGVLTLSLGKKVPVSNISQLAIE